MAETSPTPEEHALRRRARRRLVGAIALALLAVVVLPLVFDSEPRPMGNNVNIVIPSQKTPFKPMPAAPEPASAAPAQKAPAASSPPAPAKPHEKAPGRSVTAPAHPAVKKPVAAHEQPRKKTPPARKAKPKAAAKASKTPAKSAYYLQLGSFANEANAKKMVARARSVGFRSSIYHVAGRYKVRVGPIADKAKADDYENQLKTKGFSVLLEP